MHAVSSLVLEKGLSICLESDNREGEGGGEKKLVAKRPIAGASGY